MKICSKCKQELDESQFNKNKRAKDGLDYWCKICCNERNKKNYKKDRDKKLNKNKEYNRIHRQERKKYSRDYQQNNKEKRSKSIALYYQNNKEKIKNYHLYNKEKIKEYQKKYYQSHKKERAEYLKNNKEEINIKANKYQKEKKENNLNYRIIFNMRNRLNKFYTGKRKGHMSDYINCSYEDLKKHILSQLTGEMTEENYGLIWEIDHILPCSSFDLTKEENIHKCFHYTNLQPLLISENRSKNAKLDWVKK